MTFGLPPGLDQLAPQARDLYIRDLKSVAGIEKLRFFPLAVESGFGCTLVEAGGRELLDLTATWTAAGLGHGHPRVVEAMTQAAKKPPGAGGLSPRRTPTPLDWRKICWRWCPVRAIGGSTWDTPAATRATSSFARRASRRARSASWAFTTRTTVASVSPWPRRASTSKRAR